MLRSVKPSVRVAPVTVEAGPGLRIYSLSFLPASGATPLSLRVDAVKEQAERDLLQKLRHTAPAASVAVSVSGTPPQLHAETDSKELALATVATDKITLAGVQHTALHSRSSPLHRPGETALRVFAPHESAAALLAVLRQADLQTYVLQFTDVVHLTADAEDSGAVKIAWAVMQPGARMPEGGISIPVRVQVPAVQEGVPATEQLHYVELSEFADALRAMPARKRARDGADVPSAAPAPSGAAAVVGLSNRFAGMDMSAGL